MTLLDVLLPVYTFKYEVRTDTKNPPVIMTGEVYGSTKCGNFGCEKELEYDRIKENPEADYLYLKPCRVCSPDHKGPIICLRIKSLKREAYYDTPPDLCSGAYGDGCRGF